MRAVLALLLLALLALPARAADRPLIGVEFLFCDSEPALGLAKVSNATQTVYVGREPQLTNDDIDAAYAEVDRNTGAPLVRIVFTPGGARRFADLTTQMVGRMIAIVADGVLLSAPLIMEPILDGEAVISGNFTMAEAKRLAEGIVPPYGDIELEVRNAELQPAAGLTRWLDADRREIYVGTDIVVTEADIASLTIDVDPEEGRRYVQIALNPTAAERFARWTQDHPPALAAVFMNGQYSFVFGLDTPVTDGKIIVAIDVSQPYAERLVRGLTPAPKP